MARNDSTAAETCQYLAQLHACFVVWIDAMELLRRARVVTPLRVDVMVAIGSIALAYRDLTQVVVAPPLQPAHHAAVLLLEAVIDALDALAKGHGRAAVRDMAEQLTIFQMELVRLAEQAGWEMQP